VSVYISMCVCIQVCVDCWLVNMFIKTSYIMCAHVHMHTDCVKVMQKKPNKNKTEDATQNEQQVPIVTGPIIEAEISPTKGGTLQLIVYIRSCINLFLFTTFEK